MTTKTVLTPAGVCSAKIYRNGLSVAPQNQWVTSRRFAAAKASAPVLAIAPIIGDFTTFADTLSSRIRFLIGFGVPNDILPVGF